MTTTRPYLIRAFYEWIVDNNCTPYIVVNASADYVDVPTEYVEGGQIVLNISLMAVQGLILGQEAIEFQARFGGRSRKIYAPISAILAIYAKENGRGMVFAEEEDSGDTGDSGLPSTTDGLEERGAFSNSFSGNAFSDNSQSRVLTGVRGKSNTSSSYSRIRDNVIEKEKNNKDKENKYRDVNGRSSQNSFDKPELYRAENRGIRGENQSNTDDNNGTDGGGSKGKKPGDRSHLKVIK